MEKADETRFWDRFIALARQHGVPEKALRWYVRRLEHYIAAHSDQPLRRHGASHITDYLRDIGREHGLQGWQFRQVGHALQLLFTDLVRPEWAKSFDWSYWLESAKELEVDHPTVARHNRPIESTVAPASHAARSIIRRVVKGIVSAVVCNPDRSVFHPRPTVLPISRLLRCYRLAAASGCEPPAQ